MDNPFLSQKIECPICKTINEFEMIRVGAFTEDGRDTDFCPLEIHWRVPRYQAYNPLAFFTATCTNCFYTRELTPKFKEWKKDNDFRTYRLKHVKEKHLEQLSTADSVIKRIGEAIDIHAAPNESAILKLLLAVFDESAAEHPSNLDLGRFYLRIGWLFRDLQKGENPQRLHLKGMMHELDAKYGMLSQVMDTIDSEVDVFRKFLKTHFETDQVSADIKSKMLNYRDRLDEGIDELVSSFEIDRNELLKIGDTVSDYRRQTLGDDDGSDGQSFGGAPSFEAFLAQLHSVWNDVAESEIAALQKAIFHYKKAFESGRDISAGPQQIQASYLIAELSRRTGDYDQARQFFTSTIKAGQDFIYKNRNDKSRTVLARKILELAIEQGRINLAAANAQG